jgi:hypothetical protein
MPGYPCSTRNPRSSRRMAHWLFNFSEGDREQATSLLRAKMWGVGRHEGCRDAVAAGDLALIYLPAPERVHRTRRARDGGPRLDTVGGRDLPGVSPGGVLLSHVEEW